MADASLVFTLRLCGVFGCGLSSVVKVEGVRREGGSKEAVGGCFVGCLPMASCCCHPPPPLLNFWSKS